MTGIKEQSDYHVELEGIAKDLTNLINAYEGKSALVSCQGQGMDGFSALGNFIEIGRRARDIIAAVQS